MNFSFVSFLSRSSTPGSQVNQLQPHKKSGNTNHKNFYQERDSELLSIKSIEFESNGETFYYLHKNKERKFCSFGPLGYIGEHGDYKTIIQLLEHSIGPWTNRQVLFWREKDFIISYLPHGFGIKDCIHIRNRCISLGGDIRQRAAPTMEAAVPTPRE